ncbi:hypothetical protein HQ576_20700, partial [bacterium]|nr:hypothetical protein [bacterium]
MPTTHPAHRCTASVTRRRFLRGLVMAPGALAIPRLARAAESEEARRPPNVVLIISDDQHWGEYG